MIDYSQVMAQLKELGTDQNIKVYKRHGSGEKVFGVSFNNLRKLARKIGSSTSLARELWASGNSDARSLALLIADPLTLTSELADQWARRMSYYVHADLLAALVAQSPLCAQKIDEWTTSSEEFIKACGYALVATALKDGAQASRLKHKQLLSSIAKEIHASPNRARHSMNMALIAIGIYDEDLRDECIKIARRIGKVEVDHGQTGCKTPDAESYIRRSVTGNARTVRS